MTADRFFETNSRQTLFSSSAWFCSASVMVVATVLTYMQSGWGFRFSAVFWNAQALPACYRRQQSGDKPGNNAWHMKHRSLMDLHILIYDLWYKFDGVHQQRYEKGRASGWGGDFDIACFGFAQQRCMLSWKGESTSTVSQRRRSQILLRRESAYLSAATSKCCAMAQSRFTPSRSYASSCLRGQLYKRWEAGAMQVYQPSFQLSAQEGIICNGNYGGNQMACRGHCWLDSSMKG